MQCSMSVQHIKPGNNGAAQLNLSVLFKMTIVLPKLINIVVAAGYMKSPLQKVMLHAAMTRLVNSTDDYYALANLFVII